MRWFHFVLPLVLVGACLAPKVTSQTPAPIVQEAKPKPTRASPEPFTWGIQIHEGSHVGTYEPGKEGQRLPLHGEWACVQTGLKTGFTDKGQYSESRQLVCKLPSGQMVAGMTNCVRDLEGVVDDDIQVLTLVADDDQTVIVMVCGEIGATDATTPTGPAPTFEEPRMYDL